MRTPAGGPGQQDPVRPGLRLDRLEEIDRRGLVGELLAEGIIDQAVAPRRTATSWTGG